jgi:hypothetical protein
MGITFLGIAIAVLCGWATTQLAKTLKKSQLIGFTIGFCFGLFGLLGYIIYYIAITRKKSKGKLRN